MNAKRKPSILFVYFTYTKQTLKLVEAMSEVFQRRGCDVHRAAIEFDDPRYATRFEIFPIPSPPPPPPPGAGPLPRRRARGEQH